MGTDIVTLSLDGMTCGGCVKSVTNALMSVEGVEKASVSLEMKKATVEVASGMEVQALIAAVAATGKTATIAKDCPCGPGCLCTDGSCGCVTGKCDCGPKCSKSQACSCGPGCLCIDGNCGCAVGKCGCASTCPMSCSFPFDTKIVGVAVVALAVGIAVGFALKR